MMVDRRVVSSDECAYGDEKMVQNALSLYDICVEVAVADCDTNCKFCRKEFRFLPNNVLFDIYYKMFLNKRMCLLAQEFSQLDVLGRMISVKHQRVKLLKIFQTLMDANINNIRKELHQSYAKYLQQTTTPPCKADGDDDKNDVAVAAAVNIGIRIGTFLNEGGWYDFSIQFLNTTEAIWQQQNETVHTLKKSLDFYHKRIYAEAMYCDFQAAEKTFQSALKTIEKLEKLQQVPNLAGLYANFSNLFFIRAEYDEAFAWSKRALKLLNDDLPSKIVVEVLRQASKPCVVKRRFNEAGLLIRQALNLASNLYKDDNHPHYSDTLSDYGFYLLTYDSIKESVDVFMKSLEIRREVFEKHNILVAIGHEDVAYALYVKEYSSGRFYTARDHAERSLRIMEKVLPSDHLLCSSAKRVKALILEEMALDLREGQNRKLQDDYLSEAEELHKSALVLSHRAFGEKNVQTAKHYGNLGRLYQSMKLYDKAEQMHLRAISIKIELLGDDDYEVGLSMGHLASLYNYHMKRYVDAEKLYMKSMTINMNLFGDAYSGFEYDYRGLINVYEKLDDQFNLIRYTLKLRDWKKIREKIEPIVHEEDLMSIPSIQEKFFCLVRSI